MSGRQTGRKEGLLSQERTNNKSARARITHGMRPRSSASNPNQANRLIQIDSNEDGVVTSQEFAQYLSTPQPKKIQFAELLGKARRDKNRVEVTGEINHPNRPRLTTSVTNVVSVDDVGNSHVVNRHALRPPWRCQHHDPTGKWQRGPDGSMRLTGPAPRQQMQPSHDYSRQAAPSWAGDAWGTYRGGLTSWSEPTMRSTYHSDFSGRAPDQRRHNSPPPAPSNDGERTVRDSWKESRYKPTLQGTTLR